MAKTVTVVAWQALPAVDPRAGEAIGGLETAAWQFATGLAEGNQWSVRFVVRSPKPRRDAVIRGVHVVAVTDRFLAIRRQVAQCIDVPGRRLSRFRLRLLWQVPLLAVTWPWRPRDITGLEPDPRLQPMHSDVWIAMGVNREAAAVVATAQSQGSPSLLMIRSAADLNARFADPHDTAVSVYGEAAAACHRALTGATHIVCQAAYQQDLLRQRFGRSGVLIRNAIELDRWQNGNRKSDREDRYVLWIGRFETFHKRIDRAIEIAAACPEIPFRLVANPSDAEVERRVRAELPANVRLLDYVPHDQMPALFAGAAAFLSTGSPSYEGFPNVLLQAAASGTPIVSLEDFDGFLAASGAGVVCDDDDAAAARALQAFYDGQLSIDRAAVEAYLDEHHSHRRVIERLARLLQDVTG
ncbi:glycosyltransferase [Roseimaritima sediminicola]|uniref:glycosyltransferase n=1 Tax=Roseimaritima sediminicola TaxID=2662066 RepID=UPI001386DF19|nr:glycosyltransferase [Roseimaritima sediminicola]